MSLQPAAVMFGIWFLLSTGLGTCRAVPANAPPVVGNLDGDSIVFTEGGSGVFLDDNGDATVTDSDSPDFNGGSITISISANRMPAEDLLGIENFGTAPGLIGVNDTNVTFGGTVIGTFTGGNDTNDLVILLNDSSSPAAAQSLVRALSYLNLNPINPSQAPRLVTITVADGDGGSATATVSLQVNGINNPPTLTAPSSLAATEDVPMAVTGFTFADVDADTNEVVATFSVPAGTFSAAAVGGVAVSGNGTGTIHLQGTLMNLNAFVAASNLTFVTATDVDTNLTLTVTINDAGHTGLDPGTSGDGSSEEASAAVTINVTAINDAPIWAVPAGIACFPGGSCVLTGLSASDVDAGAATVVMTLTVPSGDLAATNGGGVVVAGSGSGTLTLTGSLAALNTFLAASNVVFAMPTNAGGDVALSLRINDGGNSGLDPGLTGDDNSEEGFATVPLLAAPIVVSVTPPTNGLYTAGQFLEFTVTFSEAVRVVTNGGVPRLTLDLGGISAFAGYVAGDASDVLTFQYLVEPADHDTDGIGVGGALDLNGGSIVDLSSNAVIAILHAIGSSDGVRVDGAAPVAVDDAYTTAEDSTLNGTSVLANDSDANGDPLTALLVGGAAHGVVTLSTNGTFTYVPVANYNGPDDFTYQVSDGWLVSNTGAVHLTVTAVNDAPVLVAPGALPCVAGSNCFLTGISASDVDGMSGTMTFSAPTGMLVASSSGGVVAGGSGTGTLTLSGLLSDLNLYLAASNAVFAFPSNVTADILLSLVVNDGGNSGADPGLSGDADSEEAAATILMTLGPAVLSVSVPDNGTYVAGQDLDFGLTISQPVVVDTNGGFPRLALDIGGSAVFASYIDGSGSNVLTFRYVVRSGDGDANGIGVTNVLDFNGATIVDQASNTLAAALSNIAPTTGVLVDGAAPAATDDAYTVDEDQVLHGTSVLANDIDGNGDTLSAVLVESTTNGVLSLSANGTFTYTPATNFHGADSFTYQANDGLLTSAVAVVVITITSVNDAPEVAAPIPDQTGSYGVLFTFSFNAGTFTDIDGDTLTYTATALPEGVTLDGTTRTISGSPTNAGTFTAAIIATDSGSPPLSATNQFQFVVGKATLIAVANDQTRAYGAANPPLTLSYMGFLIGDTAAALTNPPVATTTATNRSPIGTYPITLSGGSDFRYDFILSNGTLAVSKAVVTVRAEDKVKELGAPNPALTIAYTGFALGEDPGVLDSLPVAATGATTNSPAGDYPITLSGGSDDHYDLVLVGGTLTVRAAGVARVKGTFYGLFYEPDRVRSDRAGAITVTTTDGRAFSAVLQTAGRRYPFSGRLDLDGRSTNQVARKNDFPVLVELQLGTSEGIDHIGGRVTDGVWVADLLAIYSPYHARTNAAPEYGTFNLVIPGEDVDPNLPFGDGFANVSVSKRGQIGVKSQLADGTKLSGGMFLTAGGRWPFYISHYSGGGLLLGWVTFTNQPLSDLTGTLDWVKPPVARQAYPHGFAMQSAIYGARYTPPRAHTRVIDLPTASLKFLQGVVLFPLSTRVELTTANTMRDFFGTELPVHIRRRNGTFTGNFLNPIFGGSVRFDGILIQKTNIGAGFYLGGSDLSGRVVFVP